MSTNAIVYMVPGVAICALIYGLIRIRWVLSQDPGTERMQVIGKWISDGAMAFLSREYKSLAIFVILVAILLGFSNAQVGSPRIPTGSLPCHLS